MIDFSLPYSSSKSDFISFLEGFLPEDYKKEEEEIDIPFQSKYFERVNYLGESGKLNLAVYEVQHSSEHDARVGLTRENGWLDVNNKIPEIINAMMNNQISVKYVIHIPMTYFQLRHEGFNQKDEHEREKIIDAFIKDINAKLQGHENIYTSIAYLFQEHENGSAEGQIKIEAIDEKTRKDAWVPSADHSNAQIVQALGLHPSQMGLAPQGGKMGAGSGSDQRESFNTGVQLNTIEQDILLEPLNWIATFNAQTDPNWDVTFYIDHSLHTTTNSVETGIIPGENAPGQNQIQ